MSYYKAPVPLLAICQKYLLFQDINLWNPNMRKSFNSMALYITKSILHRCFWRDLFRECYNRYNFEEWNCSSIFSPTSQLHKSPVFASTDILNALKMLVVLGIKTLTMSFVFPWQKIPLPTLILLFRSVSLKGLFS